MTDSKNMSLASYAKANCANYNTGHGCFATEVVDTVKEPPEVQHGRCLVAQGKPCEYFRKALLPAANGPSEVRKCYAAIDNVVELKEARPCPECGAGLKHRQRICDRCRRKRVRDRVRRHRRKIGKTCNALSGF